MFCLTVKLVPFYSIFLVGPQGEKVLWISNTRKDAYPSWVWVHPDFTEMVDQLREIREDQRLRETTTTLLPKSAGCTISPMIPTVTDKSSKLRKSKLKIGGKSRYRTFGRHISFLSLSPSFVFSSLLQVPDILPGFRMAIFSTSFLFFQFCFHLLRHLICKSVMTT